jgi:hypothetical protein
MSAMKRVFLLMTLFLASSAWAGDLTFTAKVDRTSISMNDTLMLSLSLEGGRVNVSQPGLPAIPGFRSTFSGQNQKFSFINGKVSGSVVFSYALTPMTPGDHVIPALSMDVNGETLTTAPISIKVVSGSAPAAPSLETGSVRHESTANEGRDLFVTTTVDKKEATVGEQITLLFRFYSRLQLLSQPRYQPPETTGFMVEDLPPQRQYIAQVGGNQYQVVELASALFPTSPGTFTVGPASLECNVQDFRDPYGGGFFQNFFQQGQGKVLRSDPLTITVRPVPTEGRPASFRGDVGRFEISASFDKKSAQVHEPVTLTLTVSGEGNVKSLAQPQFPKTNEFKTYETLSSLNIEKSKGRVRGSKVFTTVMKPEVSGDLTFPALALSYFDPQAKSFKTVRSGPLTLKVSPADPSPQISSGISFTSSGEGVRELGRDIRFINTQGPVGPQSPPLWEQPWFPLLQTVPGVFFFGLWGVRLVGRHGKTRLTPSAARRALRAIKKASAKGSPSLESLHRVFLDYLGAKVRMPPQSLTSENLRRDLAATGFKEDILNAVDQLWTEFDLGRYAPSSSGVGPSGSDRLVQLIRSMEKNA